MFNNVSVTYDERKDIYTISGFFGLNFKRTILKILGKKKASALFIDYSLTGFSFYSFFTLEVYRVLETLTSANSKYSVDVKSISNFLKYVDENIWDDSHIKTHLDRDIIKEKMIFKILPHQEPAFDRYEIYKDKLGYRGLLFDMAAGSGKALRFNTPVLTPDGWKKIYKLKIGDVVIGRDGKPTNVKGVYPQGIRQLYRLTFADGRTIDADGEHLWSIKSYDKILKKPVTTLEIINKLEKYGDETSRLYLPLFEPDYTEASKHAIIDPYLLGVLIGDGGLTIRVSLHNPDEEIINKCKKVLGSDYDFISKNNLDYGIVYNKQKNINPLKEKLDFLGLFGKTSLRKFIPDSYFNLSAGQRLCLLQGLLDTDGHVGESGSISYSSSSKRLADDVVKLVRSLGGMAHYNIKYPTYTHNGVKLKGRPNYNVNIRIRNQKDCVTVSKKKDRLKEINQYTNTLSLRIDKIEKIDEDEAICIAVDNKDKLFVTKDYIVTHNTYTSLALTEALHSDKVIMIVPNQTIDKVWIHSLQEELYKEPQAVFLLQDNKSYGGEKFILVNYESLEKLEEFIKENNLKGASVIVDESHNFANAISKRTKKLTNVLDAIEAENILMMSGTPVKAYSRELGVIMKILDTRFNSVIEKRFITLYKTPNFIFKQILPERFGEYSVKVKKEKLELEQPVTRYIKIKLKNGKKYTLDSIREDLRRYIEKRAEELLANFDMYKQTYEELYQKAKSIAMLDGVKEKEFRIYEEDFQAVIKLYNQNKLAFHPDIVKRVNTFEKEILLPRLSGEDKKDFREAKTVVKYLLLKLQGEALANVVMRARIECHKDIASNLSYSKVVNSTTKKTIIFSNYIDVCEAGKNKLQKEKFTPVTVYGNTSKNLSETVGIFNKDPLANPLVTTYKSLSTGVPLITANVVLALDLPFRMYIYEQAIARVWRLGQDKQVIVYIPELDTGDELNINGRNLDIITFYKEEVERITGHKLDIDIESDDTISNEDFKHLIEGKIYVPKTVKRRFFNVLTDW